MLFVLPVENEFHVEVGIWLMVAILYTPESAENQCLHIA
jgi:hypothetical protein